MFEQSFFGGRESAVASYCRSFPAVFARSQGAEIWDEGGRRYLDFLSGAGALNYGHNNADLKEALLGFIASDGPAMSLDLRTSAKSAFMRVFSENILQPRNLDYCIQFTGPTGANAVEAALKLARKATGRQTVATFTNGFHGMSLGALSVTGNSHHRGGAGTVLNGAALLPFEGYLGDGVDTLAYFGKLLADPSSGFDCPAAVILECVQGEGGLNVASNDWLQRLQSICRAHGILIIVDDIQAGCGRTGTFFSFEESGIFPDIVTLSKSLSGYGLPFSIVLMRPEIDCWTPGEHNGTFRGNNHAFVTATAAIELFWKSDDFSLAVQALAARVTDHLDAITAAHPSMVLRRKGRGMMQGIACRSPEDAAQITRFAYEDGLIIERAGPQDEVIKVFAPLTISEALLDEGMGILSGAFDRCATMKACGAA